MPNTWPGRAALAAALFAAAACGRPEFTPPDDPPHVEEHGGAMHAIRAEDPFSCGIEGSLRAKRGVPCPTERPADLLLSCDASGCHGTFDFSAPADTAVRELRGSEGPSCYTCHGEKWEDD